MVPRVAVLSRVVTCLVVTWFAAACTGGGAVQAGASSPSQLPTPPRSSSPVMSSAPASSPSRKASTVQCPSPTTTHPAAGSATALLKRLQTRRISGATLPSHLHATGVGIWHYADAGHVGAGYLGSAQVFIRSDVRGESIVSTLDVFGTAAQAAILFDFARCNFRTNSPTGFRVVHLVPAAEAFCGPQEPADTMTCWVHYQLANGIVDATIPSPANRGDGAAVLQALLAQLVAQS